MIRGDCAANGINIHYLRTGGEKPPVVALHGLSGSGDCWCPVVRTFASDYDVVMPDARGHGHSSAPPDGYRYADYVGDVISLIDTLALSKPILMGHSMGGLTAAVVARQLSSAVRAVILVDPTFLSAQRQREVYESDAVDQHRQFLNLSKDAAVAQARVRQPHRSAEMIDLVVSARLKTQINAFDVLMPPNPDYRALVSDIDVPILLVIGDKGVVSQEMAEGLQTLNPRLQYELITDAGHGIPYDQPDRLAAVVGPFLRAVAII